MRLTRPGADQTPSAVRPKRLVNVAASRRRSATRSGGTSLTQPPTPDSEPARYFSLPGERSTDMTCRCSRDTSRPWRTGTCPTWSRCERHVGAPVLALEDDPRAVLAL